LTFLVGVIVGSRYALVETRMEVLHLAFTLLPLVLGSSLFLAFVALIILDPAKPESPEEEKKTVEPQRSKYARPLAQAGSIRAFRLCFFW
jgi:hypothetical protein